jgi:hypothetical protein
VDRRGLQDLQTEGPRPPTTTNYRAGEEKSILKKKSVDTPLRVARVLKLVDEEEDLEAQQPLEAAPGPISIAPTIGEELDVEVIEAPLMKKRKLVKGVEVSTLDVKAMNVANFLAAQRK